MFRRRQEPTLHAKAVSEIIKNQKSELEVLKSELEMAKKSKIDAISSLNDRIAVLEIQVRNLEHENEKLRFENSHLLESLKKTDELLSMVQREKDEAVKAAEETRMAESESNKRLEELLSFLDSKMSLIESEKERNRLTEEELVLAKTHIDELQKSAKALSEEVGRLRAENLNYSLLLEDSRKEASDLMEKIRKNDTLLEAARAELDACKENNVFLKRRNEELKTLFEDCSNKLSNLEVKYLIKEQETLS